MATNFRNQLYQFIASYIQQYGCSPSFFDMTAAMEISPRSKSLISRSLKTLEKEGLVSLKKSGRQVVITIKHKDLVLLGQISAGLPIEAISDYQSIDLSHFLQGENRFALLVKGHSMIEEGILDGDIIICQHAHLAQEGDIVVALIDGHHATLKKLSYKMKGMITLIPANPLYKPRAYSPERITIQGIYRGLVRVNA